MRTFADCDSVIFDLDGTLWDTTHAVVMGWNLVVRRHGIDWPEVQPEQVRAVTGRPHAECIRIVFDALPEDQLQVLIEETEAEDIRLIEELGGELYAGVEAGLRALSRHRSLYIVSNCQAGYIETFLEQTGYACLFADHECWGNTGEAKTENVRRVIERNGLERPVFVGDAEGDESAARANGIPYIHVAYGFGTAKAPDRAVESFGELVELFA